MYRPDIKTIYIDFDNTLVDTIKTIVSLYNEDFEYYKKFHHVNWWEIDSYDFKELTCASKEYINIYFNTPRFFYELEFMPDAHEIIDELGKVYQVKIVSMGYSPNLKQKEEWINQYLFYPEFIGVNMKKYKDKSHIDMSDGILIDDSVHMLETSNAQEKYCFGDIYSWNKDWTGKRLMNWTDIAHLLL